MRLIDWLIDWLILKHKKSRSQWKMAKCGRSKIDLTNCLTKYYVLCIVRNWKSLREIETLKGNTTKFILQWWMIIVRRTRKYLELNKETNKPQTNPWKPWKWYCIVPRCSVTFWTHPEIIPVGQFFRRWIKSINQSSVDFRYEAFGWLIDGR